MRQCPYEQVTVPTALYGAETWGMRIPQRRVNVREINCLSCVYGTAQPYRPGTKQQKNEGTTE